MKQGFCPPNDESTNSTAIRRDNCYVECSKDSECPGEKKCCYSGCSKSCMKPVVGQ